MTKEKKKHNLAFGKVLRELRKARNLTQETFAFECGLDRTYISLLELGSQSPTLDTIVALCEGLDITLTALAVRVEDAINADAP